jgi:predicted ATP-binding protein involved in virulence
MNILFKKIRWQNLLSTGNIFTEIDFTKSPSTLIVGENGAGKCLDPSTKVDISFDSLEKELEFIHFINRK